MGRTVTRWDNNDKNPYCVTATLTVTAGGQAYFDFSNAVPKLGPDRVIVYSSADAPVGWLPSDSTSETLDATPTPTGSPGAFGTQEQGYRYLQRNLGEILEFSGGARIWHFRNHSAGDITLTIEAGIAASPNG